MDFYNKDPFKFGSPKFEDQSWYVQMHTMLYLPEPFSAAATQMYSNLPWFMDYSHLTF